jgi:hypothetical protein
MAEVGGVLPGGRLELRRSQAKFSSNPEKNFAGFEGGEWSTSSIRVKHSTRMVSCEQVATQILYYQKQDSI